MKNYYKLISQILVLLVVTSISPLSHAEIDNEFRNKNHFFSLRGSIYPVDLDIKKGFIGDSEVAETVDLEYGYRIYNPYSFLVFAQAAPDGSRGAFGFGLRVDFPGWFFYDMTREDLFRSSKQYPVNTSCFVTALASSLNKEAYSKARGLTTRYGVTAEIFIVNETFVVAELFVNQMLGNSVLATSFGLGHEW